MAHELTNEVIKRTIETVKREGEGKLLVVMDDSRMGVVFYDLRRVMTRVDMQRWPQPHKVVGKPLKRLVNNTVHEMFASPDTRRAYELIVMRLYNVRQHGIEVIEAAVERRVGGSPKSKPQGSLQPNLFK